MECPLKIKLRSFTLFFLQDLQFLHDLHMKPKRMFCVFIKNGKER